LLHFQPNARSDADLNAETDAGKKTAAIAMQCRRFTRLSISKAHPPQRDARPDCLNALA
jgi:hypothetical protein